MGRAFAVLDTVGGWGFAAAFLGAGALIALAGVRALFAVAGGLGLLVFVASALAFRGVWVQGADGGAGGVPPRDGEPLARAAD
jgi:hypothetical protein